MSETPTNPYEKKKEREGYVSILAKDIHDGGEWHVLIPASKIGDAKRLGMGFAKELGAIVPAVLRNPKAIFRGIRFDDYSNKKSSADDWLCYVGLPTVSFDERGSEMGPYENEVFLVFVNLDRVVYHWRWEKCCPDNVTLPVDHQTRFRERIL
jgi:hypothetical protein